MFITVHQIDELWFKLVLRELVTVRDLFARDRVPEAALASAVRGIRRMALLFHHLAGHFAVMETMTTRDYLAFRDKLFPASGFQSSGLREIEILCSGSRSRSGCRSRRAATSRRSARPTGASRTRTGG
jgi:tryptophan 2,3-dioxygenase